MSHLKQKYKHNPKLATVIVTPESGTLIRMPNGDIIPGLIMSRVTDDMNEPTFAIIKIHVNLGFTDPELINNNI